MITFGIKIKLYPLKQRTDMSTTTDIACLTHKVKLWIGQRDYIYTAEPETMESLNEFLQTHARYNGCLLVFTNEHDDEIYGDEWVYFKAPTPKASKDGE